FHTTPDGVVNIFCVVPDLNRMFHTLKKVTFIEYASKDVTTDGRLLSGHTWRDDDVVWKNNPVIVRNLDRLEHFLEVRRLLDDRVHTVEHNFVGHIFCHRDARELNLIS